MPKSKKLLPPLRGKVGMGGTPHLSPPPQGGRKLAEIKVVFFDAGGTLFRPYPSVGEIYSRVAAKHGVQTRAEDLEKLFHDVWHSRNGLASLAGATSDRIERDWWYSVVREVFSSSAPFADFEAFFSELYELFATAECWKLFDDALPLLNHMRQKNLRLGVISNCDHR